MQKVFLGLTLALTLLSFNTFAALSSNEVHYYGEKFHQDLASGIAGETLKTTLHDILQSTHQRTPGDFDQITPECSGSGCYKHISLGYDRARIYLLGNFYLVDNGDGDYAIKDVYCDTLRSSEEFPNGDAPAPNKIPGGTTVNTEHTWPQSRFTNRHSREMQKSDMHHLFPTDNEMNSVRGSNPFGEVVQDRKTLRCKSSRFGRPSRGNADVFEPPQNHRGNVARALFYFSVRYETDIDPHQEATLRKWSKEDPIDEEEVKRNNYIYKMQGSRNPFIDFAHLEDSIENF